MRLKLITAVTCAAFLMACASSDYQPRGRGVHAVIKYNDIGWYKDGQPLDVNGYTLGGLEEAVAAVPQARAYAKSASTKSIAGQTLALGGLALEIGGLAVAVAHDDRDTVSGLGAGLLIAGLVATLVGVGFISGARANAFDAANAYNDAYVYTGEHADP